MRKQITDVMGTYEVNIKNKPEELINTDNSAIYLNLFDNGEIPNAVRYKLSLCVSDENKQTTDWHCNILNDWEAARWLRQVPQEYRGNPFYKQTQYAIADIKNNHDYFDKRPSAGFFKAPRTKGMEASQRPILPNATAMMFIVKDANPYVYMRFMDYHWDGYLQPNSNSKQNPKYSMCIKSSKKEETVKLDYAEYL